MTANTAQSGFTLIETITALALGVFVAMFVTTIAINTLISTAELKESERLHADMMHMTSRVGYLIKQSAEIEGVSSSEIRLRMPFGHALDEVVIEFSDSESELLIDGESVLRDEIKIAGSFEGAQNSVRLEFVVNYEGSDREHKFTTTLARRNI